MRDLGLGLICVLLVPATMWAVVFLSSGFKDSLGEPIHRDFGGHVWIYVLSLTPIFLCLLALTRLSPPRGIIAFAACLLGFAAFVVLGGLIDETMTHQVRVAGPLVVATLSVVAWGWLRPVPKPEPPPPADRLS
jgi:hypothetical protein